MFLEHVTSCCRHRFMGVIITPGIIDGKISSNLTDAETLNTDNI